MDHSIVIPTRNNPRRLAACLASILEARCRLSWEFEVLVMDNSDAEYRESNADAVSALADIRVRHVPMTHIGLMAARHEGVEAARGDAISFIDEDELLLPGWIEGVQSCLRDPRVALVTGPLVPKYEARPPSWVEHLWTIDRYGRRMGELTLFDGGDVEKDVDPTMVWGGNLTVRRSAWEKARGSHPDAMPSPWEAFQGDGEVGLTVRVRAAGLRARYSPECAVLHAVPSERMTVEHLQRRQWYVGIHTSYTDVRREAGMGPERGVPALPVAILRPLPRRAAGRVARAVRAAVKRAVDPPSPVRGSEAVARDVKRRMAEAHRDGYVWHREQLATIQCLREYVCRPDYLGANARLPHGEGVPGR